MVHILDNSPSLPSSFPPYLRSHYERPMNSSKRPRSPEAADGYEDRPTKRPSLAVGEFNRRQLSHSSAASSRQGSEDWVQRAGGLTIDSPIYTPGDPHYPFLHQDDGSVGERPDEGQGEGDVDMAMESEETETRMEESQERETVAPLSQQMTSLGSHSSTTQYQGEPHAVHRHPYPTRYSERKQSSMTPLINVVPAPPVHMLNSHQQYHIGASNDNSQLEYPKPDSASLAHHFSCPMAISPASSFSQVISPTKRRVVFGPRANWR
ncbi:hypothetical protein BJ912DRAFT_968753, partial [Pholiota molesta]